MDAAIDLSDASKALDLANIRFQLIRLEDTIIFHLIERVQFPLNQTIHVACGVDIGEPTTSLFDWMLREQERLQSLEPILKPLHYPQILHPNTVNVNAQLKDCYIKHILPAACMQTDRGESQENYGSSATCDVMTIQSLSRRIHFGKFVAEAKFQQEMDRSVKLIKDEDRKGIDEAITNAAVEKKVLERLKLKAKTYATDPDLGANESSKVNADAVVVMYKDWVIPRTKEVEVEYLMQR
ncbi:chorismate mutase [Decorospora gaudefroyi]|uniref:Chorismate mutase n=1 Tax=Decorospora gaudefroyi TaxID=184978 RepID=A0A6A5JVS6_9PLEO|nr:chorismate mutase [Decorospora gaudefroyi]